MYFQELIKQDNTIQKVIRVFLKLLQTINFTIKDIAWKIKKS